MAVFSVLLGVAGTMVCCCFPAAIPACLLSVVMGHASIIFINRSQGRLTGFPVAVLGLVTGYLGLALCAAFWFIDLSPDGDRQEANADPREVTAESLLNDVENKIRTGSRGIAHGNNEEAKALAEEYSQKIQVLREALFTEKNEGISLSGGKFITYCELREGQCAFVVHVPEYRRFEGDAKDSLADLAWMVGQQTVAGKLAPGDELAVALKGVVLYGSVMVGKVGDPEGEAPDPEINGKSRDDLLDFFIPEEPAEDAGNQPPEMIELPAKEPASAGEAPSESRSEEPPAPADSKTPESSESPPPADP